MQLPLLNKALTGMEMVACNNNNNKNDKKQTQTEPTGIKIIMQKVDFHPIFLALTGNRGKLPEVKFKQYFCAYVVAHS